MACPRITSTGDYRVTSTGDDRIVSADVCSAVVPSCVRVTSFGDFRVTDTGDYRTLSADVCSPVTPVTTEPAITGGARVLRKGEFPKWWEEWEEPQPKKMPPKSAKERLAETASDLRLRKPEIVPLPKAAVIPIRPKITITREVMIRASGRMDITYKVVTEHTKTRRMVAAALLLLLEKD